MVALVGFEIEELETNEFPHCEDQVNENYPGVSVVYLKDHGIVPEYILTVEEVDWIGRDEDAT